MAIRDEQGFERVVFSQASVVAGTLYSAAHGIDASKIMRIHGFAKDTVNGVYVENFNPCSGQINGLTATSQFESMFDATNWLINVPVGSTNLAGATINVVVYLKP
jgi:hypothetical protein